MRAPSKGGGYALKGYGVVLVKGGPSPEKPYVWVEYGPLNEPQFDSIHIDEFWKLHHEAEFSR